MVKRYQRYTRVAQILHWSVVALICIVYVTALLENQAAANESTLLVYLRQGLHRSYGILLFFLVVFSLVWKAFVPSPRYPKMVEGWKIFFARAIYLTFYILLLVIPLTGWLSVSSSGYSSTFLSMFALPDLAPVSEVWSSRWSALHLVLTDIFILLVGVHVIIALKHQFIDGDKYVARMLSVAGLMAYASMLMIMYATAIYLPDQSRSSIARVGAPLVEESSITVNSLYVLNPLEEWRLSLETEISLKFEESFQEGGGDLVKSTVLNLMHHQLKFSPLELERSRIYFRSTIPEVLYQPNRPSGVDDASQKELVFLLTIIQPVMGSNNDYIAHAQIGFEKNLVVAPCEFNLNLGENDEIVSLAGFCGLERLVESGLVTDAYGTPTLYLNFVKKT